VRVVVRTGVNQCGLSAWCECPRGYRCWYRPYEVLSCPLVMRRSGVRLPEAAPPRFRTSEGPFYSCLGVERVCYVGFAVRVVVRVCAWVIATATPVVSATG
jgi:hypothetical protein